MKPYIEQDFLEPITNDNKAIQYFIVDNDAFDLKTWLMKPIPEGNSALQKNSQLTHLLSQVSSREFIQTSLEMPAQDRGNTT